MTMTNIARDDARRQAFELYAQAEANGDAEGADLACGLLAQLATEEHLENEGDRAPTEAHAAVRAERRELVRRVQKYARDRRLARSRATDAPPVRTTRRERRRARAAAPASPGHGDDPPPPLLVSQRTSSSQLGLTSREFIALLKSKPIEHARHGRVYLARLADVLVALGLAPRPTETIAPISWSPDKLTAALRAPAATRLRLVAGGSRGAR